MQSSAGKLKCLLHRRPCNDLRYVTARYNYHGTISKVCVTTLEFAGTIDVKNIFNVFL